MSQTYQKLSIEDFGRHLLTSGDLDPVYILLHKAGLPVNKLAKWCLAYWCCYHPGVSCWLTEQDDESFWEGLMQVAVNTPNDFPRGTERRHFRGQAAVQMVQELRQSYATPLDFINHLYGSQLDGKQPIPFKSLDLRIRDHRGFGPWISFKIADMLERIWNWPVVFDTETLSLYKDPTEGAELLTFTKLKNDPLWDGSDPMMSAKQHVASAMEHLIIYFNDRGFKAPPTYDRCIGVQEVETILCKWKSHMKGHYPLDKDSNELRRSLHQWGPLANRMLDTLNKEILHGAV